MPLLPALLLALAVLTGRPDILPEGMKGIHADARVELGPFAERAILAYAVNQGDTLGSIAKELLGTEKRWKEIEDLNPGLEPNKLRIGQVLTIPARTPPHDGQEALFVYFDPNQGIARDYALLPVGGVLPTAPRRGHLRIYLVPTPVHPRFKEALATQDRTARAKAVQALIDGKQITALEVTAPSRLVPTADPTARRDDVYRIEQEVVKAKDGEPERIGPPTLRLVSSERFDSEGKPISGDAQLEKRKQRDMLLMLLFAGIGGSGLLVLHVRRRELAAQRARATTATSVPATS